MSQLRKIAVMTGTRADYGLLKNLIAELNVKANGLNRSVELQIIATGSHLSAAHGMTVDEIKRDGYVPAAEVAIWSTEDSSLAAAVDTGEAVAKFAKVLAELEPDVVVVLGDRLEAFAMATAATILLIPVAHIHGGELTLGAMDDSLRHSITKLSYLHFTTTDEHRARVIQLGEEPSRVFNFGAPVLDALERLEFMNRAELVEKFGIRFGTKQTVLMTFHPAAFDEAPAQNLIDELLAAMEALTNPLDPAETQLIVTGTNNDIGSAEVRAAIAEFHRRLPDRVSYVESFGQLGYLSVMREVDLVTGNSSSTVLEAPVLGVPSVLVGNRQEGRPMSASVLKPAQAERNQILAAMRKALDPEFRRVAAAAGTPFGTPGFAQRATAELLKHSIPKPPKKKFWSAEK
jgi:UDP-hydrolysing UDP-N-acetyl-D-glucosamine 2-epimerase